MPRSPSEGPVELLIWPAEAGRVPGMTAFVGAKGEESAGALERPP